MDLVDGFRKCPCLLDVQYCIYDDIVGGWVGGWVQKFADVINGWSLSMNVNVLIMKSLLFTY